MLLYWAPFLVFCGTVRINISEFGLLEHIFTNPDIIVMYSTLLHLHSGLRWLFLIAFACFFVRSIYAFIQRKPFKEKDKIALRTTTSLAHLQLLTGIVLYFISPIVSYFLHNPGAAIKQHEFRFFGIEHSLGMITAIVLISYAAIAAKKKKTDYMKFRTIVICYSTALLIILAVLPYK